MGALEKATPRVDETPQEETLVAALEKATPERATAPKNPIHCGLIVGRPHQTERLEVRYASPDSWERFDVRLVLKDPTKGCFDPAEPGTDAGRDWLEVVLRPAGGGEWRLRLPAYAAHLVDPTTLYEIEDVGSDALSTFWSDGTWSGSLVWDAAVHVTEEMLGTELGERMRGTSVLELACGLGLPGLTAHCLGASRVVLSDRGQVVGLVEEGLRANRAALSGGGRPVPVAAVLDWGSAAARELLQQRLGGSQPDWIIACDCIFESLFGSTDGVTSIFLLLRVLELLCSPTTRVLVGLERRTGDGAEKFLAAAEGAGFVASLRRRHGRVVIFEMGRARMPRAHADGAT
ncbi:hypothetical protein EMIHUDRAFT_230839 [Emiliania huxleyi CCMP1516]|uniref:Uncharacterized protein n=2 Tax=Emiliania huxleyi TaxID=2903 RepID=A0A0D3K9Q9_EMIH1|nr:hypothetical protein EMIHUDRAFT_99442 [Emiliania huxleyi CCMP1516]XP_005784923.1 hypothetical protein EMIHUDRAFT_230839 [Emiliania huxleyi CCMP1516]EOD29984.1 hypothetical protein EMIHUDRAFT_99442 [Emiliania huxleyi CCMP1516]EOD32494.1 hypothetical protein EMIHUDRAFT_230839 [Emiliania huxleyi CCMP1516]|mmetsp:Transcript_38482/g.114297  ORF Transcript_38482/g.114297 Transcript_38482/m.114297 type:complete len:347 (+) Transcript_38482:174-1214(+)|eukprot:XP_005782413.1 hypothetical protein EMIHUDRAFT_99442 [Emiliania huxleyi CCMP1516]